MGILNIMTNKILPKFTLIIGSKKEKFNSVMALKMRAKQLDAQGVKYEFRENW